MCAHFLIPREPGSIFSFFCWFLNMYTHSKIMPAKGFNYLLRSENSHINISCPSTSDSDIPHYPVHIYPWLSNTNILTKLMQKLSLQFPPLSPLATSPISADGDSVLLIPPAKCSGFIIIKPSRHQFNIGLTFSLHPACTHLYLSHHLGPAV